MFGAWRRQLSWTFPITFSFFAKKFHCTLSILWHSPSSKDETANWTLIDWIREDAVVQDWPTVSNFKSQYLESTLVFFIDRFSGPLIKSGSFTSFWSRCSPSSGYCSWCGAPFQGSNPLQLKSRWMRTIRTLDWTWTLVILTEHSGLIFTLAAHCRFSCKNGKISSKIGQISIKYHQISRKNSQISSNICLKNEQQNCKNPLCAELILRFRPPGERHKPPICQLQWTWPGHW